MMKKVSPATLTAISAVNAFQKGIHRKRVQFDTATVSFQVNF